jgi:ATP-binding cassette, subfamily B, multidrug efflux pump
MTVLDLKAKSINLDLLKRVIRLSIPFKKVFLLAGLLSVIIAPVSSVRPYLFQVMIDDYVAPGDFAGLNKIALYIFLLLILEVALRYAFIYSTNLLGQSIIKRLRDRVFSHINTMPLRYFDRTPIGTSTTRAINDIEAVNAVFTQGVITIFADILSLVAVLAIMFQSSWQLTLICLSTLPLLLLAVYIFKEKVRIAFQKVRNQIATMNAFLQERITGMRIVQLFSAEEKEAEKFRKINRDYTQANIDSIFHYSVFFPAVEIISALSLGLMVWWGASGVLDESVTMGALIAFPVYLTMLFRPVRFMADKFNTLQMGMVAAERVFNLLDMQQESVKNGDLKPDRIQGDVRFSHVWFAYEPDNFVIKDLSFHVPAGQTLAIVGSTGSGKSTIINILNRFYDWDQGDILLDGVSLKEYDKTALRRRMAMVLQDVFLFSGSVLDNIRLNDTSISAEEVHNACQMIKADQFIEQLPGGYDFLVAERGSNLSTGQRQLIAFARALVFNPDILILDEATSSIDAESESLIQYAIETLISKRTSIIIAHRLSTIRHAQQIMVMEKGQMVECGNHDELLKKENGKYKKLYEMQFLQEIS